MTSFFTALLSGLYKGLAGKNPPKRSTVSPTAKPARKAARAPSRDGHGEYAQEVVGEASYQPALRALKASEEKPFHRARLVPEDNNPYDEQAVRVDIGGTTVGYLPRASARAWRKHRVPTTCDAFLADAGGDRNIGVWLRF